VCVLFLILYVLSSITNILKVMIDSGQLSPFRRS